MTAKKVGTGALLLLAVLFVPGAAHAQTAPNCPAPTTSYAPGRGQLTVSDATVDPKQTITATGCGYKPGTTVNLDFLSTPVRVATVTAGANGGFTAQVTIPGDVVAGSNHTLESSGVNPQGAPLLLSASLTVNNPSGAAGSSASRSAASGTSGTSSGTSGGVARTGSNSTQPLTMAGIGLIVIGAAAVLTVRRRRTHSAELD
ncbi:MAG: hypothetical protein QOK43_1137 [Acidimicrobiaceae bacterium]|nr:hypothetical protein [Acidimicrobiaceae bacterium]MDQ1443611.1 hypothetical protein [Acidimicrobiaceae bacterium]